MPAPDDQTLALPETLQAQLAALRRRQRWVQATRALALILALLGTPYLLLFLSDRFWETPQVLRIILAAIACFGGCAVLVLSVRFTMRRLSPRDLAYLVRKVHPIPGDELLGIIELTDARADEAGVSPALCRAAIQQVSTRLAPLDLRSTIPLRTLGAIGCFALLVMLLVIASTQVGNGVAQNVWARWSRPLAEIPRVTVVSLHGLPGSQIVAHGEEATLGFQVQRPGWWHRFPVHVRSSIPAALNLAITGNRATLRIPNVTVPLDLEVRAGDALAKVRLVPLHRPTLHDLQAELFPPAYLGHPSRTVSLEGGGVDFTEGSAVIVQGSADRALDQLRWEVAGTNRAAVHHGQAQIVGSTFTLGPVELNGLASLAVTWRDTHQMSGGFARTVMLRAHPDAPPTVEWINQPPYVAMLEDEVVELHATAQDDLGLRRLEATWATSTGGGTNLLQSQTIILTNGHPQARALAGNLRIAPRLLGIQAGHSITLTAHASDYFPGRAPSDSMSRTIYVISRDEHLQLVQVELERAFADLEELARRQETLLELGKTAAAQSPAQRAKGEETMPWQEQAAEERALATQARALSERGAATLREALRNPDIPPQLLSQWARPFANMEALAQNEIPTAAATLQEAAGNSAQRAEKATQALSQEAAILSRLREGQRSLAPALDHLFAHALARRMRAVGRAEQTVSAQLLEVLPRVVGLKPDQLRAADRANHEQLKDSQSKAARESGSLHREITRFEERTGEPLYAAVAREMGDTQVTELLEKTGQWISSNIVVIAMTNTSALALHFERWAGQLDAAFKKRAVDSPATPAEADEENKVTRFLTVLRLRQHQEGLRDATIQIEEQKEAPSYREQGKMLSISQLLLADEVRSLESESPGRFLVGAETAMRQAEALLNRPLTDAPTVAAETDALNLIDAELQSMLQDSSKGEAGAAMAFMQSAMAPQPGANQAGPRSGSSAIPGGGNPAGRASTAAGVGPRDAARSVERLIGPGAAGVPSDYRELLQLYQKRLEEIAP